MAAYSFLHCRGHASLCDACIGRVSCYLSYFWYLLKSPMIDGRIVRGFFN